MNRVGVLSLKGKRRVSEARNCLAEVKKAGRRPIFAL